MWVELEEVRDNTVHEPTMEFRFVCLTHTHEITFLGVENMWCKTIIKFRAG